MRQMDKDPMLLAYHVGYCFPISLIHIPETDQVRGPKNASTFCQRDLLRPVVSTEVVKFT